MKWTEIDPENKPGLYCAKLTAEEIEKVAEDGPIDLFSENINLPVKQDATTPRDKTKTEQDVQTDPRLFSALDRHFGFNYDLACTKENKLCKFGLTPSDNALRMDWHQLEGYLWLNPPYANIEPWARKCYEESLKGAKIVLLTPASVGSNWFRDFIYLKAWVRFLNGRLTFVGHKTPYPRDCMISIFDTIHFDMDVWNWSKGWG